MNLIKKQQGGGPLKRRVGEAAMPQHGSNITHKKTMKNLDTRRRTSLAFT
jgi:hypothetical protein